MDLKPHYILVFTSDSAIDRVPHPLSPLLKHPQIVNAVVIYFHCWGVSGIRMPLILQWKIILVYMIPKLIKSLIEI